MLDGGEQRGWPAGGRMGGAGGNSLTDNDRTEAKGHSKGSGYKPSSADQADGWWDEGECKAVAWASWIIAALWNVHEVIVYKCQLSSTAQEALDEEYSKDCNVVFRPLWGIWGHTFLRGMSNEQLPVCQYMTQTHDIGSSRSMRCTQMTML